MAIRKTLSVILPLCLTTPAFAADEGPLRLPATTKWRMEYANDSCELIRQYGTGKEAVIMVMQQFQPGDQFQVTLVGKPVRTTDETRHLRIRFGPSEEWQTVTHSRGSTADKQPMVLINGQVRLAQTEMPDGPADTAAWLALAPLTPEREAKVTEFLFDPRYGNNNIVVLDLGSMGPPMAAIHKCTDALVTSWGLNPQEQKSLLKRASPKSSPAQWMKSFDYPTLALWAGQRALINFRLNVDMGGKVTDCQIQAAIGEPEFSKAVCQKLMQRADFEPALNAAGQPVASYFVNAVRFDFPASYKK